MDENLFQTTIFYKCSHIFGHNPMYNEMSPHTTYNIHIVLSMFAFIKLDRATTYFDCIPQICVKFSPKMYLKRIMKIYPFK